MMTCLVRTATVACLASVALAGCTATGPGRPDRLPSATETTFRAELYRSYASLSEAERRDGNETRAAYYARRADEAASKDVLPPRRIDRRLPSQARAEIAAGRARLVGLLKDVEIRAYGVGTSEARVHTARAQVMFDCWLENLRADPDSDATARCRTAFSKSLAQAEASLEPRIAKRGGPVTYVVYFPPGDAALNVAAQAVAAEAAAAARKLPGAKVIVSERLERARKAAPEDALSSLRASAVAKFMAADGVEEGKIEVRTLGATPHVMDGAKDGPPVAARRVEILIRP